MASRAPTRSSALVGARKYLMGVASGTSVRGTRQDGVVSRVVQRVVQAGEHARRVAEGRVGGEIFDTFAVDPDLARTAQAFQVLCAGERAAAVVGDDGSVCDAMDGLLLFRVRAYVYSTLHSARRTTIPPPRPGNLTFSWGFSEHFGDILRRGFMVE